MHSFPHDAVLQRSCGFRLDGLGLRLWFVILIWYWGCPLEWISSTGVSYDYRNAPCTFYQYFKTAQFLQNGQILLLGSCRSGTLFKVTEWVNWNVIVNFLFPAFLFSIFCLFAYFLFNACIPRIKIDSTTIFNKYFQMPKPWQWIHRCTKTGWCNGTTAWLRRSNASNFRLLSVERRRSRSWPNREP